MINVKELRKDLGLTQEKFARKMDVAIQTIRRWEKGERRPHQVHTRKMERLRKKVAKS